MAIERTARSHWGRLIAALSAQFRDIELAEDAMQDALTSALVSWERNGVPNNPEGWLYQTARRKAIDRLRRLATHRSKADSLIYETELNHMGRVNADTADTADTQAVPDERLRLIFACCHPALPASAHTALTLKTVCGLTTSQIASAYLSNETAMAQRIVRAKRKIKNAGIPFELPRPDIWPERWASVLAVIYLIFNEGYSTLYPQDGNIDLCEEALRLGRILRALLPDEAESGGLLALMLLSHARRPAREMAPDVFIPLEHQNRKLWHKDHIAEAQNLLIDVLPQGALGPYQIQAVISALHVEAKTWQDTDWAQITALYKLLYNIHPSPVILVNQAVAISFSQSVDAAIKVLGKIEINDNIARYQPYHAAKADFMRRAGRAHEAIECYKKAASLSTNLGERNFLMAKCSEIQRTLP